VQGQQTHQRGSIDPHEYKGAHIKKKTQKALDGKCKFDRTEEGRCENWTFLIIGTCKSGRLILEPIAHDARVYAHHFSLMSRTRESSERSFSYVRVIEGTRVDDVRKAEGHVRSCQEGLRPIKDWYEHQRAPNLRKSKTSKL
jgi:hypothetical protein